jgi:Immunoglobulin-like domain of bacterial spore germination
MKKPLFLIVAIGIIFALTYFFVADKALAPTPIEEISEDAEAIVPTPKLSPEMANTATEMIEVTAPLPNSPLTSPMTLTGRARGPWYFEASFPIELRDANNVLIGTAIAQAQGEWMTENFVPFTATLTFPPQPAGSQGMLTFKNDNPSGESQNSMMFDVPVTF